MQILTSGSFINLDNREKVEQLIFTAKAIADSAVQTDGFVSSEENNRRLALEIWQGAEYMTREHEQARIQNLFVGNFLERLSEIEATSASKTNNSPVNSESQTMEISPVEASVPKDEFLGFVTGATTENERQEIAEIVDVIGADFAETKPVEILSQDNETATSLQEESLETPVAESVESLTEETSEVENVKPEAVESFAANQDTETKIANVSETEKNEKPAIGAIKLPEKEPYRWDDCTVTATIQLMPVGNGVRKVVFSVRTHDFAPQISVVELQGAAATPEQISPLLEKAFERYKADLPVKVMDKMKREKSAGKKGASKPAHDAKSTSSVTNSIGGSETKPIQASASKPENIQPATTAATPATQPVASQTTGVNRSKAGVKNSKPETSAQGNLFGF